MKSKHVATFLPPLALVAGLLYCFPVGGLDPGSSMENDWQSAPPHISLTADKLELGLRVSPEELARFDEFCEKLEK